MALIQCRNFNPFFNRVLGISAGRDFIENLNPLPTLLFQNTIKFSDEVRILGPDRQFREGLGFVKISNGPIIGEAPAIATARIIYKVVNYVFALLATLTIIIPLATLIAKAIYSLPKIKQIKELVDRDPQVLAANAEENFRLHQNEIRALVGLGNFPQFNPIRFVPFNNFRQQNNQNNLIIAADQGAQPAIFRENGFTVRAAYQEILIEDDKRAEFLRRIPNNPEHIQGLLVQIENEALAAAEQHNQDRRAARQAANNNHVVRDDRGALTPEDFAQFRYMIDFLHIFTLADNHQGTADHRILALRIKNYALAGKPQITDRHIMGAFGANKQELTNLRDDIRTVFGFFTDPAAPINLEKRLSVLKAISEAFKTCSPTWTRITQMEVRKLNNPEGNIADSVEGVKDSLRQAFHSEIEESLQIIGGQIDVHTINAFIVNRGAQFGFTANEIQAARLDQWVGNQNVNRVQEILFQRCTAKRILRIIREKLATEEQTVHNSRYLCEVAAELQERGFVPEGEDEDWDPGMWVGTFHDRDKEMPYDIPEALVKGVLQNLGIFEREENEFARA